MNLVEARDALRALAAGRPRPDGAVRLELGPRLARLVIDNPGSRHAMTAAMMSDLGAAVVQLSEWDGAAVILTSSDDRAFCAGGHLREVAQHLTVGEAGLTMSCAMATVLDGLLNLPVVSVAAIRGPAVGGGAEIATATDFRVISQTASLHFAQARLGVAPGWGGSARLALHVGSKRALRVLASAASVTAGQALDLGLVDRVDTDALTAAGAFLEPMLKNPTGSLRAIKKQIVAARGPLRLGYEEAHAFIEVWGTEAHRRAMFGQSD